MVNLPLTARESSEKEIKYVEQIVLEHYNAIFAHQDASKAMEHVADDVKWMDFKAHYVAHSKQEFEQYLRDDLDRITYKNTETTVVFVETMPIGGCFVVNGELKLRVLDMTPMAEYGIRFSVVVAQKSERYYIVSIHTTVEGEHNLLFQADRQKASTAIPQEEEAGTNYDELTGLYKLDVFKRKVENILQKENVGKFALICTDISNFERVNNVYGLCHADEILVEMATMLTTTSVDVLLCCRSVADHFLALVECEDKDELKGRLVELCKEFEENIGERYYRARPRLGIGAYCIGEAEQDMGVIVEHVNTVRKSLRYQKGKAIAFYDTDVFSHMEKVREIEKDMENALETGEFQVYLQPKYNLGTGQIVGAEALSRWIKKDGTKVYPDEFIPVFENNGYIKKLDFFVLHEICHLIQRRLQMKKKCVPISVNQSRILLGDENYVSEIAKALREHETPPEYIELELTERIFQEDMSEMAEIMSRLKEFGIHWSIDDFGTGYSSLNLLKDLPVDTIKLDRSFLEGSENSDTNKVIIRKTVELTQELDKTVVCEGVETESQADYLKDIKCDIAQGYLYARPMPMEEFEKLLDKEMNE